MSGTIYVAVVKSIIRSTLPARKWQLIGFS